MHEGLRVDVLVVLGEVEPALQRLVDDAAVVAAGQAELRLHRGAEQRTAELVEAFALDHDAGRGSLEGLDIGDRQPHVLQPQRLQRLEAEDVADDRGREIGDRAGLEQVEIIGDIGEVAAGRIRHRVDPVALGAVLLRGRQTVGPHHRPGRGRGFAGHRGAGFGRIDAVLRRHPEQRDDVGVLGLVVRLPIAHALVFHHAGLVAILAAHRDRLVVHVFLLKFLCASQRSCCDRHVPNSRIERAGAIALRHLRQRNHLDLRCVAGGAELLEAFTTKLPHRIHRRLQEFARVELALGLGRRPCGTPPSSPAGSRYRY